jgi:hypothetical protein
MANEECRCPAPGGRAVISPTGCCERCGVQGSKREMAIQNALASGRTRLAAEIGKYEGRREGVALGLVLGRKEATGALLAERLGDESIHPPQKSALDVEMELG